MLSRRMFLDRIAATLLVPAGCAEAPPAKWQGQSGEWVNDIHSRLNRTRVRAVHRPRVLADLQEVVNGARDGESVCIAGGRHAMGGQQFAADGLLLDMRSMNRVLRFDRDAGLIEVEAGIEWPGLLDYLLEAQRGLWPQWGFAQKQTGADRLSLGGALSANVHGRGLKLKPFISDVESFVLVDAEGRSRVCSRQENAELFGLAIGGYGLFGVIASVTLRLTRRRKIERVVEIISAEGLAEAFEQRIAAGFLYGDFQFSTDRDSDGFLNQGVFSCYRPVDDETPIPDDQRALSAEQWTRLITLAHADRKRAYEVYATYYRTTSGQIYWSDSHQMSLYIDDYHSTVDRRLGSAQPASEMIAEIYVPRPSLARFLDRVKRDFRAHDVALVYGTIRLIEEDDESFLAWARQPYACIIFNLHAVHTPEGLAKAAADFRRLIGRAIEFGGSYYLTYHRWATRQQVETCYPQLARFLDLKRRYDPAERFQSDWYRHYRAMFAEAL